MLLRYTPAVLRVLVLSRLAALLLMFLFGLLNFAGNTGGHQARKLDGQADANTKPNILLIMTDDMRAGQVEVMPFLKNQLIDKGDEHSWEFCLVMVLVAVTTIYLGEHTRTKSQQALHTLFCALTRTPLLELTIFSEESLPKGRNVKEGHLLIGAMVKGR